VFIDHRGPYIGNVGSCGQLVDDELVEAVVVWYRDVHEEVLGTRSHEHANGFRQLPGPVTEGLDVAPGRGSDPYGDECLNWSADRGEVHVEQRALDHPSPAKSTRPFKAAAADDTLIADMPAQAQETRIYAEYLANMSTAETIDYRAISLVGPRNRVSKLVHSLALLS